ncbi:hypothetical protein BKA93DRAFT_822043 [Sparassis latifolia]
MGCTNAKKHSSSHCNPLSSIKTPSCYSLANSDSSQKAPASSRVQHTARTRTTGSEDEDEEVRPPKKKSTKAHLDRELADHRKKRALPAKESSDEDNSSDSDKEDDEDNGYSHANKDTDEDEEVELGEGEMEIEAENEDDNEKEDEAHARGHKCGSTELDDQSNSVSHKRHHTKKLMRGMAKRHDPKDKDEREELIYTFEAIITFIPGLKDQLAYMGEDINAVNILGSYLNHYATDAHGDHLSSLRERIINYIPDFGDGYPTLKPQDSKWKRAEPDGFCRQVCDGEIDVTSDEFPLFLYDQDLYDPDELDAELLKGPVLLSCFKSLITGPGSASSNRGDREGGSSRPGCPRLAKKYDMTHVSPRSIAYVAVLVRFLLNSQHSWSNIDVNFNLEEFFFEILWLLQDEEWGEATLDWWNKAVFGTTAKGQGGAKKQTQPQSASTKLKAQHVA